MICYIDSCSTEKFIKSIFKQKDVGAILKRLDRLSHNKARMTGAEILKVVYGLVQDMSE